MHTSLSVVPILPIWVAYFAPILSYWWFLSLIFPAIDKFSGFPPLTQKSFDFIVRELHQMVCPLLVILEILHLHYPDVIPQGYSKQCARYFKLGHDEIDKYPRVTYMCRFGKTHWWNALLRDGLVCWKKLKIIRIFDFPTQSNSCLHESLLSHYPLLFYPYLHKYMQEN